MMSREIIALCVLILVGVAFFNKFYNSWEYKGPGVLVAEEPIQKKIRKKPFFVEDFKIIPKAEFSIKARVIAKKGYKMGIEANLSPVDLVLGWGPMSDASVLRRLKITQSNRWYEIKYNQAPPIPHRQLMRHSANMHMLPADEYVADNLGDIKPGQVIQLSGYLVYVFRDDGWRWYSSLTRTDSGARSCEVVWVEQLEVVDK